MNLPGAGELDRRIQLQSSVPGVDPDYNEGEPVWSTYATVWAKQEFHQVEEGEGDARRFAAMEMFFTIRWRPSVVPEHRVVFENETYEIIGRPRELGRRQFLKIRVRLVE